jgi:hypothetical protein
MIENAEALLAVLGMTPVISHEIETITPEQWRRVLFLEREIDEAAKALVTGKPKPATETEGIDYMSTLHDLSTPYVPHQVEAMLAQLPPWFDSGGPFLVLASRAFDYMGSKLPRQVKKDLTGPEHIEPPARLVERFVSLLEVLDDPVGALRLAANAQLLGTQIEAMEAVFPGVLDYMRKALAREIAHASAGRPNFKLRYEAEQGAEKLLGADLTSPALRKILQAPAPAMAANKDTAGAGGSPIPEQQMTRVQRTDNLDVG